MLSLLAASLLIAALLFGAGSIAGARRGQSAEPALPLLCTTGANEDLHQPRPSLPDARERAHRPYVSPETVTRIKRRGRLAAARLR